MAIKGALSAAQAAGPAEAFASQDRLAPGAGDAAQHPFESAPRGVLPCAASAWQKRDFAKPPKLLA